MEWNQHLIETKKNAESPRGKPNIMFFHPQIHDTQSYGFEFRNEGVSSMMHEIELSECIPDNHDPLFVQLIHMIMPDWELPTDVHSGLQLYADILDTIPP